MAEQAAAPKFDEWAVVDVMGHKRIIGKVSEQVIAGQGFIRIDVPATDQHSAFTTMIGPSSIYQISPVSEEIARHMVSKRNQAPIASFELPKPLGIVKQDGDEGGGWVDDEEYC